MAWWPTSFGELRETAQVNEWLQIGETRGYCLVQMAWMFGWLRSLLAKLGGSESASNAWVEPSNSITRAIITGSVPVLPAIAAVRTDTDLLPLPQKVTVPATRTAQRVRRRRAGRAA